MQKGRGPGGQSIEARSRSRSSRRRGRSRGEFVVSDSQSQLEFVDRVLKETREVDHVSSSAESISVEEDNEARARFKRSRSVKRTKKRVAAIKTEAVSTTRAVVGENPELVGEQGGEAVTEAAAETERYDSAEEEPLVVVDPLVPVEGEGEQEGDPFEMEDLRQQSMP